MNIEEILKKHIGEDGKVNVEAASKELKEEQGKSFVPKSDFNSKNEELKQAKTELASRDTQLEELKKVDVEKLQGEIETLQATNKTLADTHATELKRLKINQAVERQLSIAKAKNQKAVSALLDLDFETIELNDDGTVKGLDEKITTLKESEDYLFEVEEEKEKKDPTIKGTVPGKSKLKDPGGAPDVTKMNYEEFQAYIESKK